MEKVNPQDLPKVGRYLCSPGGYLQGKSLPTYLTYTPYPCGTAASFQTKMYNWEIFPWSQFSPQAKLILFPSTCSQRYVLHRVQILPVAFQCSPPNINGMQTSSACKWAAWWRATKPSCYSSSMSQEKQGILTTYVIFCLKPLLNIQWPDPE